MPFATPNSAIPENVTLSAAHNNRTLVFDSANAQTLTVPRAGLVCGFKCRIVRTGTGSLTVSAGAGVTLHNAPVLARYESADLVAVGEGEVVGISPADGAGGAGGAVDSVNGQTGDVVLDPDDLDDTATTNKFTSAAEISKLAGIASGATANDTDANLKSRANHTGTQTASTISDFAATVLATVLTGLSTATNAAISATDTILQALGKLQAQVTARLVASNNLSDLPDPSVARANLGVSDDIDLVHRTGNETIDGVKDFTSPPIVPTPTADFEAATKKYVDDNVVVGGASNLDGLTDVVITAAASGEYIRHNGTNWVDASIQAGDLPTGIDAAKIADGSVSNAEFQYLGGVTSDLQTQLNAVVHDTGDETVDGVKTFSSSPIVPTPTTDFQAATKKYVDDSAVIGGTATAIQTIAGTGSLTSQGDIGMVSTDDRVYVRGASVTREIFTASTGGSSANDLLGMNAANDGGETKTLNDSTTVTVTHGTGTVEFRRAALTGDVTASANSNATTIANNAVTTAKIADANVTLAKIANASANSKLLGAGAAGSGAAYTEITLGTGLSMSGNTLNASGGGGAVATDTIFDAKGDLAVGTGADTAQKLTAGANKKVLVADSAQTTGLKWESRMPPVTFKPRESEPPATNYPPFDLRNNHPVLNFDGSTDQETHFTGYLPLTYTGGGLTVDLIVGCASATTGTMRWQADIERNQLGTLDIDADSFTGSFQSNGVSAPGTSGIFTTCSIAFTDGAQMDSLAAGEPFRLKIRRDADGTSGTDDIGTDCQLLLVVLRET